MAKYVFLDIDGVLNYDGCRAVCADVNGIDEKCLERLAKIIRGSGARIVLSSSWREFWDREEQTVYGDYIDRKLRRAGMRVFGKTGVVGEEFRGAEIEKFLECHPQDGFVILDDTTYPDFDTEHFVKTDSSVGITDSDVEKALSILEMEKDKEKEEDDLFHE